jgi:hypothetical protein
VISWLAGESLRQESNMISRKRKAAVITMGIVILLSIFGFYYIFTTSNNKIASLNDQINAAATLQDASNLSFVSTQSALVSTIAEKQKALEDLDAKQQDINSKTLDAKKVSEILKNRFMCENIIPVIDYKNDLSVSASLKKFVSEYLGEPVQSKNIMPIFDQDPTSYHIYITQNYFFPFIVFYDGPGRTNGVYDVFNQCFVNYDNK